MTCPIGKNIRDVCCVVEQLVPISVKLIGEEINGMNAEKSRKYCLRAKGFGFLRRVSEGPTLYAVSSNWRALIETYGKKAPKQTVAIKMVLPLVKVPNVARRNSVFDVWV